MVGYKCSDIPGHLGTEWKNRGHFIIFLVQSVSIHSASDIKRVCFPIPVNYLVNCTLTRCLIIPFRLTLSVVSSTPLVKGSAPQGWWFPLQTPFSNPDCHLYFWLASYKYIEVSVKLAFSKPIWREKGKTCNFFRDSFQTRMSISILFSNKTFDKASPPCSFSAYFQCSV